MFGVDCLLLHNLDCKVLSVQFKDIQSRLIGEDTNCVVHNFWSFPSDLDNFQIFIHFESLPI